MAEAFPILMLVALQQAVLALGWLVAARLLPPLRVAALHWAAFGLLSALGMALYGAVAIWPEPLRVSGNLILVAAMLLLQRGLRLFIGQSSGDRLALAAWLLVLVICLASLTWPELAPWRVAVVSLMITLINLATVTEVVRYVRDRLSWVWSLVIGLPMLLGAVVFLARGLLAVAVRAEVVAGQDVPASFVFAVATMLVSLVFQLSLLGVAASRLSDDLRRAARHDALTGALNRGAGEALLADEAQRARRLGAGFALLMLDLDHFKAVNDRLGHAAGDRALQHAATLLGTQLREIDRLVRWGGEEFLMLLPGTSQRDACVLAQRLCERLRSRPLVWNDERLALSASVGVASWAGDGDDVARAIGRADAALYAAKRDGRDRVAEA